MRGVKGRGDKTHHVNHQGGELYTALEQKTVDAQENPLAVIYSSRFFEVQKYLAMTGHFYSPAVLRPTASVPTDYGFGSSPSTPLPPLSQQATWWFPPASTSGGRWSRHGSNACAHRG
jgi:hypothetical protein